MRKMKQYAGNIDNISEQNDDEQESYNRADYLKTFDLVKEEQVENLEKKIIIDDNSYHKKELLLLDYPNEEEPADPFSVHSSNNINAYIQFILKEDRSITIANIEATRFPWLYSEKKEFLQERLNEYIKAHKKNNSLYKINCLNVKKYIENILTYDLNQIEYNISFKFDSEWIDYFGKARDFFTISPEIEFINFDEELKRSSNEIAKLDCDTSEFILSHCIEFYKIRIKTDARGWLTSLRVYIDDDRNPVINQKLSTRIDKKDTFYTLYVNNISLKDYRRLSEKSIIHFEFDFEEKSITHSIEAKYDATSIPVNDNLVHLFMDMGSTYTKFIVAQSDLSGNILKIRRCIGPKPTSSYCESLSVDFDKKDRTESGTEAFGQWLVQSLRKISQEHYKRGEIIHSVVWSFPAINDKLNQMFYPTVSDIVNSHAGTFIYDEFILIPEHEALKYMFDHVLKTLARVGQNGIETINQKNTKIDLENAKSREVHNYKLRRYSDYQDRWWITKLFIDEVYHPGELNQTEKISIPEYYQKYLEIGCHDGLKNFIIIDAGGFSLDVYGEIGSGSIKKSFEAGGQQLNRYLEREIPTSRSFESEKIEICSSASIHPLVDKFREWTRKVYTPTIDEIISFLHDNLKNSKSSGVSIVLTGQAFKNRFLHDLLLDKFKPYPIGEQTSSNIGSVIKSNPQLLEDHCLEVFYLITCRNEPLDLNPISDFDIAGGSLLRHLELLKEVDA